MVIPQLLKVHWFIHMSVKEGRRSEKKTKLYLPSIPFTENRYFLSVQHKLTTICLAATLERLLYESILVYFAYICVKSAFQREFFLLLDNEISFASISPFDTRPDVKCEGKVKKELDVSVETFNTQLSDRQMFQMALL